MLSQCARYALKSLLNLARQPDGINQVRALAEQEHIPRRFLEVIMVDLRKAGLVESIRGKTGGYRLGRPANLVSFADNANQWRYHQVGDWRTNGRAPGRPRRSLA